MQLSILKKQTESIKFVLVTLIVDQDRLIGYYWRRMNRKRQDYIRSEQCYLTIFRR